MEAFGLKSGGEFLETFPGIKTLGNQRDSVTDGHVSETVAD
jgi:hypothetical protein